MPIPSGTKLGTYEVTSHIGSGGMDELYQVHDSELAAMCHQSPPRADCPRP